MMIGLGVATGASGVVAASVGILAFSVVLTVRLAWGFEVVEEAYSFDARYVFMLQPVGFTLSLVLAVW